jgi:glycosyltransferase involved in cell wall biosynthesis
MVAAEAAASAVPPVSADHSGMREVAALLGAALEPELARLLSFPVGPNAVTDLADRLGGWLDLAGDRRRTAGMTLAKRVAELWSWEGVARGVIAASRGDLEELPHVVT